jgi:hypothetical protein
MPEAVSNSKTSGPGPDRRGFCPVGRDSVEPCILDCSRRIPTGPTRPVSGVVLDRSSRLAQREIGFPPATRSGLHEAPELSVSSCCRAFAFGPFASFALHPESCLSTPNREPTLPQISIFGYVRSSLVTLGHVQRRHLRRSAPLPSLPWLPLRDTRPHRSSRASEDSGKVPGER